jgi:hypothetical protein
VPLGAAAHTVRLWGAGELDRHDGASAHTDVMQYAVFTRVARQWHRWHVIRAPAFRSALHCRARQRAGVHAGAVSDWACISTAVTFSRAYHVADAKFGWSRTPGAWLMKPRGCLACVSCDFVEAALHFSLFGSARPQAAVVEPAAAAS